MSGAAGESVRGFPRGFCAKNVAGFGCEHPLDNHGRSAYQKYMA